MDRQTLAAAQPGDPAQRPLAPAAFGQRKVAIADVELACSAAQTVVAAAFGQLSFEPEGPKASPRPARTTVFARQIAMYLSHIGFGVSMADVGKIFDRDRTTVVHACHVIEDRRDEARFDHLLDHLEQAATALGTATRINRQGERGT